MSNKKLIVLKNKNFLDKFLSDVEEITSLSTSAIIEECIFQTLLPKNKVVCEWISKLYENEINIKDVLIKAYDFLSIGVEIDNKYIDGIERIITFPKDVLNLNYKKQNLNEYDINLLIIYLESIVNRLENNFTGNEINDSELKIEIKFLENYIVEIKEKETSINIEIIYNYIYRNFWMLKKYSRTYLILSFLINFSEEIEDSKENRYELIQILKLIFSKEEEGRSSNGNKS